MTQYDPDVARFFGDLQIASGRGMLYSGYLARWMADVAGRLGRAPTALDFGCGNGLYAHALALAGARQVCGYDPSEPMVADAWLRTKPTGFADRVRFTANLTQVPASVDVAITLHTTYHFSTDDALASELFTPIGLRLAAGNSFGDGELLLIVANPAEPVLTPGYYWNSVEADVAMDLAGTDELPVSTDGFVALTDVMRAAGHRIRLADKTRLRATFCVGDRQQHIDDTYHTERAIIAAARECGLRLIGRPVPLHSLRFAAAAPAYTAMHFRADRPDHDDVHASLTWNVGCSFGRQPADGLAVLAS